MCFVYFTSSHFDVPNYLFLDSKQPLSFLFNKLLIRIQLEFDVSCFIVQLWRILKTAHCLGLDVFIVFNLRFQLLVFFNRGMIQVILWEEFTSCSPSSPSGINAHVHIWFNRMVQHRRTVVQPKSTGLSLWNGTVALRDYFSHLPDHLLHHGLRDFLLLNGVNILDFNHRQWQRIMGLIIFSLNFFSDCTWIVRLVLIIDVELFKVSQDQISFLGLLWVDIVWLHAHRRRFHAFSSF